METKQMSDVPGGQNDEIKDEEIIKPETAETEDTVMPTIHEDEPAEEPQAAPNSTPTTDLTSHSEAVKKNSRIPKKKILITLAALLVLGLTAGGSFMLGKKSLQKSKNAAIATKQPISTQNEAVQHTQSAIKTDDITYFDSVKALGSLKLIDGYPADDKHNSDFPYSEDTTQYYQIGTTKDGKDVIYILYSIGLGGSGEYLAISDKTTYTVFTKVFRDDNPGFKWAKNVTLDETTTMPSLRAPETAEFSGQPLKSKNFFGTQRIITPDYPLSENQKKDLGAVGPWKFTRTVSTDEASYQIISLQAKFNNLFTASYALNGEMAQNIDKALAIKWSKGDSNQTPYDNAGQGCGNSGFMVPKNFQKGDLVEVGTTPGGQKLYQLPISHAFVKDLYDKDYNKGEYLADESLKNLTIQQLTDKHAYILVQNSFGDYVVMLRSDIFIRGGCAKPVIYLYPTQQTTVSVGVGAQVTLSEPLYPAGGWRGVVARPDGTLTYQGKQYGSLFWEGYGQGAYPAVTSGTIVPTAQALATIQSQLYQQGLNQKEASEFMEFWKTKLPSKPYTRLTWFGNKELGELAPLYIAPRPATLIRVFLDSEGLDKPISLPQQHFSAPARKGFTVVEWGGLARDGSVPTAR